MLYNYYLDKLGAYIMPTFLIKYLSCPTLQRLKKISYFCGVDHGSKDVYDFKELISRYDHSLSCALLTYKLTKSKKLTIAALFHDISTPCFSHVIDYMNKDYKKQESTEKYTYDILSSDQYLMECLKQDNLTIDDIANFKDYSIVDIERPGLCADRVDGIILSGLSWTRDIGKYDIDTCVSSLDIYTNERGIEEIGFNNLEAAERMVEVSANINAYCHSNEDNYMMELLAKITRLSIDKGLFSYEDLYINNEKFIFKMIERSKDTELAELLYIFQNIKKEEIPITKMGDIKERDINPLVKGRRMF